MDINFTEQKLFDYGNSKNAFYWVKHLSIWLLAHCLKSEGDIPSVNKDGMEHAFSFRGIFFHVIMIWHVRFF